MPDTLQTRDYLESAFADNSSGDISAQDLRDFLHTTPLLEEEAASVDNAIVRMSGTDGKTVQTSLATIDDSGNASVNAVVLASLTSDPGSPVDGTIWHRSDLDEIRIRVNGVTLKLVAAPVV